MQHQPSEEVSAISMQYVPQTACIHAGSLCWLTEAAPETSAIRHKRLVETDSACGTYVSLLHLSPRQKKRDSAMYMKLLDTLLNIMAPFSFRSPTMLLYAKQAMAGAATHIHMDGRCRSSAFAANTARWNVTVNSTSHMMRANPNLQSGWTSQHMRNAANSQLGRPGQRRWL